MFSRRSLLKTAAIGTAAFAMPGVLRAQQTKTLRVIPQSDLAVLDPLMSTAMLTMQHGYAVFDTLYGMDANFRPQPQMVEGHTISDDAKTWTLTLRDGLRFHDGEPVLGRDVVASIKRWGVRDVFGRELMAAVDEITAPTDKTVVFRLKRPFPMLPNALGKASANMAAIMPERLANTDPGKQVTEMIGSGPFRFASDEWVSGSRIVYKKFTDYSPRGEPVSFTAGGKVAHLDRIELSVMPDSATAAAAMMAGEADVWELFPSDLAPMLASVPDVVLQPNMFPTVVVLVFNHLQAPFDNPAVRRAVLPVIDQAELMTAISGADRTNWHTNVGFFSPASPMASTASLDVLSGARSMEAARKALAQSGYDGTPIVMLDAADINVQHATTLVLASKFREMGFTVDVQTVDFGTLVQRRSNKGPSAKGGWNLFVTPLTGMGTFDPSSNFALRGNGEAGWYGWPSSPNIERLRQEWFYAHDVAGQKKISDQLQAVAFEDLPYVPLGALNSRSALAANVTNFPRQFSYFYGVDLA